MTEKKIDYKKEYKELYQPSTKPTLIEVPRIQMIAVEGKGNPNTSKSYQEAIEILYGLSFSIKMSKMKGKQPEGYFEYVVPPLEGLWYIKDAEFDGILPLDKDKLCWISMILQPKFVTEVVLEQAKEILTKKKPQLHLERAKLWHFTEGLCVQAMHIGPYDAEPKTIQKMKQFIEEQGYQEDLSASRYHHEIYLSNPNKCEKERLKTVLRHPIK